MNHKRRIKWLLGLSVFLLLAFVVLGRGASPVVAQSGGGYDLTWNTIASGGTTFSTGGGYELGGTAGQPGTGTFSGGGYALNAGFWNGVNTFLKLFLPFVAR
jgi:hypothetical protein